MANLVELMNPFQADEDTCAFRMMDSSLISITVYVVKLGNFGVKT